MTDPRDRFEELMAKIMSDGLATIDNLTDKELEMIDLEKPYTYEYIVGDIVQVVATNAEDAERMIADGNYEVIEAYSQCVAVRNA